MAKAERITTIVTLVGEYSFANRFNPYLGKTTIYKMQDADGKIYTWKTSACLEYKTDNDDDYKAIIKNDVIEITASVKGESEYKGEPQTELNRVKVNKVVKEHITKSVIIANKKKEQMESLGEGDRLWEMPYRQYKMHYADCETLAGSYREIERGREIGSYITIILREGRLKASGVRGERFSGYELKNEVGEKVVYRAVSEENAVKRASKEFPGHTWEVVKIYRYN